MFFFHVIVIFNIDEYYLFSFFFLLEVKLIRRQVDAAIIAAVHVVVG
jgi:hypothetical protein